MRQGQQNRRGRGRNNNNNNNRKSHNPLARSFESNGPDVKIRGTPAHIAEKYLSLARDAQSSGDPVLAENYLQHAEHYTRIIMAYREQLQQPGDTANGNGHRMRGPEGEGDEFGGEDDPDDILDEGFQQPLMPHQMPAPPPQQQNRGYEGPRHENNRNNDHNRHDRPFRRDQNRFQNRNNDRNDRDRGGDRDRDRGGDRDRGPVENRPPPPPQQERPERQPEPAAEAAGGDQQRGGEQRRRDRFQQPHEQPEFLRRPVRRPRVTEGEAPPAPAKDEPPRD